jgi:hypothetical protein
LVTDGDARLSIAEGARPVIEFYAASIAPHFAAHAPENRSKPTKSEVETT